MAIYQTYREGIDKFALPEAPEIKVLYKYREITERNLAILTNKQIYFSKATAFNDPFDVDIPVRFDLQTESQFDEMSITIAQKINKYDREKATEFYYKVAKGNPKFRQYEYRDEMRVWQLDNLKQHAMVFCLSSRNDSILMWSHYSSCHLGMCIGFDPNFLYYNTGVSVGKVKYHDVYPVFIPTIDDEDFYIAQLLSKAEDWTYEDEFRFIDLAKRQCFDIEPQAIREIVLGCCTPKEDKNKVIDLVKYDASLAHVKIYAAEKVPYEYKLKIMPI